MSKSALEKTWLCHELGRCHLEKGRFEQAKSYGEQSLEAADSADDPVWQLNASVLIAQAEGKEWLRNHYWEEGEGSGSPDPSTPWHLTKSGTSPFRIWPSLKL